MEIEQLEIRDFIARSAPLERLPGGLLDEIAASLEITYFRRGTTFLSPGEINHSVYLVRTGAIEIYDETGSLYAHSSDGEWVGHRSVLRGGEVQLTVRTLEDSLLYLVPGELFKRLVSDFTEVARFFDERATDRLRSATEGVHGYADALNTVQVRELLHGGALVVQRTDSIGEVARQMSQLDASACLVVDGDEIVGIVTDRAFCTQVAARGIGVSGPIARIMTPNPITIDPNSVAAEAMALMARRNIKHLPVTHGSEVMGILTATDLLRRQGHNIVYLVNRIHEAKTTEELVTLAGQLPETLVALVESSMTAYDIGHVVSSVGEAITVRLLRMAEDELGDPPIPYAWVVAGSLARDEQAGRSDQDNAIILSDNYRESSHGEFFEQLARRVSDGLDACGYEYCPGDVMATNPRWRQPQKVWSGYYREWIESPEPKALMYTSIFFDVRAIHGTVSLLDEIKKDVLARARGNSIFLAHLAGNALQFHPPLGLFRNFVLEAGGTEEKALNLKKRGVVPVIDLARVFALASGLAEINTQDRLEAAAASGGLSETGMSDLRYAFEFIGALRLRHQAEQIRRGQEPDNFVAPERLSSLERRHLKDAFRAVRTMQKAMGSRFQVARLS